MHLDQLHITLDQFDRQDSRYWPYFDFCDQYECKLTFSPFVYTAG